MAWNKKEVLTMSEYDGSTDIVDSISTRCVVRRLLSSPVSRPRRRRSWTFVSKSFFDLQRNVQLTRMWQLSRCHSRPGWWRHLLLSLSSLPSFIAFVLAARLVGSLALAPPAPRASDPYEMTRSWSSLVCILMSRISFEDRVRIFSCPCVLHVYRLFIYL